MTWLWRTEATAPGGPVVLEDLAGLLSWEEDASGLVRAITVAFLGRMSRAIGEAAAEIARSDHPRAPELNALLEGLPNEAFFRLLIAPTSTGVTNASATRASRTPV